MDLYYLENRTPPNGNVAYFWRKSGCGYTAKIPKLIKAKKEVYFQ